jgi:3-oxoacyl-[acyl-carrier protein] reductase
MLARRSGRIIQIDSEVATGCRRAGQAYATAKSAQIGLARSWARELARFYITMNMVAPGFIPVERHAGAPVEAGRLPRPGLPGDGDPEDIAHAVSFSPRQTRLHHRPAHRRRRRPQPRN